MNRLWSCRAAYNKVVAEHDADVLQPCIKQACINQLSQATTETVSNEEVHTLEMWRSTVAQLACDQTALQALLKVCMPAVIVEYAYISWRPSKRTMQLLHADTINSATRSTQASQREQHIRE